MLFFIFELIEIIAHNVPVLHYDHYRTEDAPGIFRTVIVMQNSIF